MDKYKFAVCRYDERLIYYNFEDERSDVDKVLAIFDNYNDAYVYYTDIIKHYGSVPNDFWIVWIKDNKAVQFDRIKLETFTRFRNVRNDKL